MRVVDQQEAEHAKNGSTPAERFSCRFCKGKPQMRILRTKESHTDSKGKRIPQAIKSAFKAKSAGE